MACPDRKEQQGKVKVAVIVTPAMIPVVLRLRLALGILAIPDLPEVLVRAVLSM
jgi:hypothetical protein